MNESNKKCEKALANHLIFKRMTSLGFKKSEISIFLTVYSFTHGSGEMYYGSRKYLAEVTGYSLRSVERALKTLIEAGFIRHPDGMKRELISAPNDYIMNGVISTEEGSEPMTESAAEYEAVPDGEEDSEADYEPFPSNARSADEIMA